MWRLKRLVLLFNPVILVAYWLIAHTTRNAERRKRFTSGVAAIKRKTFRQPPVFSSLAELWAKDGEKLFEHQFGPPALAQPTGAVVRDIVVIDNFYEDPDAVRAFALELDYVKYAQRWYSSALELGPNPLRGHGVRLAPPSLRTRLEQILACSIDEESWDTAGDGWNGAFHYKTVGKYRKFASSIHNHVGRDADVRPGGWSGLIYLSPDPPLWSGTSIWRDKKTGRCWTLETNYKKNPDNFDLVLELENRYNRFVLFQASVLHLAHDGWGSNVRNSRLFQTFFFNILEDGRLVSWKNPTEPPPGGMIG